jgi:hypothetical protein
MLECVDDLGVAVIRLRSVEGRRVGGVQRNVWQILIEIELLATLLGSASDRKKLDKFFRCVLEGGDASLHHRNFEVVHLILHTLNFCDQVRQRMR